VTLDYSPSRIESFNVELHPHVPVHVDHHERSPPLSIKEHIEERQIKYPHGVSDLSAAIQAIADALYNGSNPEEHVKKIGEDFYFRYYQSSNEGVTIFGLYHKFTSHSASFSHSGRISYDYDLEILAAGFFADGVFSVNTGRGVLNFRGNDHTHDHVSPPAHFEGISYLGGEAPLAFYSETQ